MASFFRKREIKQKQIQKRKERQQRREGAKTEKPDSFKDMIAYVDPYGVITDTPPNPEKFEEVNPEDIEVSIPEDDKVVVDDNAELDGHVKFYNENRGFGFITDANSSQEYFFHISNAPEDIAENNHVTFRLEENHRGVNAVEIKYAS